MTRVTPPRDDPAQTRSGRHRPPARARVTSVAPTSGHPPLPGIALVTYVALTFAFSWLWWVPMAVRGQIVHPGQGWPTHLPGLLAPPAPPSWSCSAGTAPPACASSAAGRCGGGGSDGGGGRFPRSSRWVPSVSPSRRSPATLSTSAGLPSTAGRRSRSCCSSATCCSSTDTARSSAGAACWPTAWSTGSARCGPRCWSPWCGRRGTCRCSGWSRASGRWGGPRSAGCSACSPGRWC